MPPKPKKKKTEEAPKQVDEKYDLRALHVVTEALAKAKHVRNYFQLERDKVHKFWDISKKELENLTFEVQNQEKTLEEMENKHQVHMKVYKQKVRHLLYEHRMQVQQVREENQADLREETKKHQERVAALRQEKARLYSESEVLMSEHDDRVGNAREEHKLLQNTKRLDYEKQMKETQRRYDQKLALLRDELELRRRAEIHDVEERKNEHINELMRKHKEAFSEMKKYYNDITSNNLDLIKSLKEEIANMKRNDEHNEELMFDIEKENENLSEPLETAEKEVAKLKEELQNYEKDKMSLRNTRSRLRLLEKEYVQLQDDHKSLKNKYSTVQQDRDALLQKFEAALLEAQETMAQKNVQLHQKLTEVSSNGEARDAQLASVLSAVNLEPSTLEMVTRKLEDVLETKNRASKDLHFELRKVEHQHREVVKEYERRCRGNNLPPLDLKELGIGAA